MAISKIAITCTPEGSRNRIRPIITWKRVVEKEIIHFGWRSWSEATALAKGRTGWKSLLREASFSIFRREER